MKRGRARLAALLILFAATALWLWGDRLNPPEDLHATAARAADGDSLTLSDGTAIRLAGIDAPELHQSCTDSAGAPWPCGREAQRRLAQWVATGAIHCRATSTDRYGRRIARCSAATQPDLGEAMVAAGLAVTPSVRGETGYDDAQDRARAARRGIWQGPFQMPADWRADNPRPAR